MNDNLQVKREIGVSYYPERWDKERWQIDAQMMESCGIRFIRTGEFAWSRLEPSEGNYCFEWLTEAINIFGSYGIKTIICTPTASPPPWLIKKSPAILPIAQTSQGVRIGGRRHYCLNSEEYYFYTERIVTAMAMAYANNENILAWQIDNEIGGEELLCQCESCHTAFRVWLKRKYQDVKNLNEAWGGVFFSFEFNEWNEIGLPFGYNEKFYNPGFKKDYYHFYSDSAKDFLFFQFDLLKDYSKQKITTNRFDLFWGVPVDHSVDIKLDVVSFDSYYLIPYYAAFHNDYFRMIKPNEPYWILEQNCELTAFSQNQKLMLSQTIQAFMKGAAKITYFSWRQVMYGCEQDACGGVIKQDGTSGEAFSLVKQASDWLVKNADVLDSFKYIADVALIYSHDSMLSYKTSVAFSHINYLSELVENYYAPLCELGINTDVITNFDELSKYALVVVPLCIVAGTAEINKLITYAQNGGIVILSGDFAYKTIFNRGSEDDVKKCFQHLTGLNRERLLFINTNDEQPIFELDNERYTAHGYIMKATGDAKMLSSIQRCGTDEPYGMLWINELGKGRIYVNSVLCGNKDMKKLYKKAIATGNLVTKELPHGTEMVTLKSSNGEFVGIFNKNDQVVNLTLDIGNTCIKPGEYVCYTKFREDTHAFL